MLAQSSSPSVPLLTLTIMTIIALLVIGGLKRVEVEQVMVFELADEAKEKDDRNSKHRPQSLDRMRYITGLINCRFQLFLKY